MQKLHEASKLLKQPVEVLGTSVVYLSGNTVLAECTKHYA